MEWNHEVGEKLWLVTNKTVTRVEVLGTFLVGGRDIDGEVCWLKPIHPSHLSETKPEAMARVLKGLAGSVEDMGEDLKNLAEVSQDTLACGDAYRDHMCEADQY